MGIIPTQYIIIKPVPRRSVQNRRLTVTSPTGQTTSTDSVPKSTLTFALQRKRDGLLNSGLDYYVSNPYKAKSLEEAKLPSNWAGNNIWKEDRITRQQELELKYNKEPGFLTSVPNYNMRKRNKDVVATYLEEFRFRLENVENKIDLETLKGEIMYEAAKVSSIIATSKEEITPFSSFYIAEVNEEEEKRAQRKRTLGKAVAALEDMYDNHTDSLRKIAVILRIINAHESKISNLALYDKVSDYINHISKGRTNIEKFMDVVRLYKEKGSRKRFEAIFFLRELVGYNILSELKGSYLWRVKEGSSLHELGRTEEVVLNWLMDKANEPYVEELKQELKIKTNEY